MKKILLAFIGSIIVSLLFLGCGSKEATTEEQMAADAETAAGNAQSDMEKAAAEAEQKAKELAEEAEKEAQKKMQELNN